MGQFSLYIDSETLSRVEAAAKKESISVSRYIRKTLEESLRNDWPPGYFDELVGSIKDPSFCRPTQGDFADDLPRQRL